jgi:magnesium transporter
VSSSDPGPAARDLGPPDDPALRIAAGHATARVPIAAPGDRAGDVRAALAGAEFDSAADVVALEDGRLAGVVTIERLLAADAAVPIVEIMDADPPAVLPDLAQERAAWQMVQHAESSLPVVDRDGRFIGLIPPPRMLGVLLAEHDEDVARLGGYMASTSRARQAAEETVGRRLWHRLPWLLVGLGGAMVATLLVGAFEEELNRNVLLAFFVPAIVYMAGAVGAQTVTVLIRGLSAGVGLRQVLVREILTGAAVGLMIGAVFLPFALLAGGDGAVAVAVALALFASCAVATLVAIALPALLQRLDLDPAFGAGPLATVVQDLLSIAIYFAIAVPLAT